MTLPRQVGRSVKNHPVLRTVSFSAWGGPGAGGPDSERAAPAESQEMAIAALWGMQGALEAPVTTQWMLSKLETLSAPREQPVGRGAGWTGVLCPDTYPSSGVPRP